MSPCDPSFTVHGTTETAIEATKLGAYDYLLAYSNLSVYTPRRKLVRSADENGKASAFRSKFSVIVLILDRSTRCGFFEVRADLASSRGAILGPAPGSEPKRS